MGSYNCIGFHSRLPIGPGDEVALLIGLHASPQLEGRYGVDPVEFAPGLRFTPIALPIMCRYDDGRMVRDEVRDGNIETLELSDISAGTEIRKIPESSKMLLEALAELEDGNDKGEALKLVEEGRKYYSMSLDLEFQKRNVGSFFWDSCSSIRRCVIMGGC